MFWGLLECLLGLRVAARLCDVHAQDAAGRGGRLLLGCLSRSTELFRDAVDFPCAVLFGQLRALLSRWGLDWRRSAWAEDLLLQPERDDRDCEIGAEGVRLRAAALVSGCQAAGYNSQDCEQRWQGV